MRSFPEIATKRLAIKLRPKAERLLKKGHPWVFSESIIKQNSEGETGDLAIIYDGKRNDIMGLGLYDAASPIRIKMIHTQGAAKIDHDFFKQKIKIAFEIRRPLLKTDTNSYRLLFGENDGFPGLIADVYKDVMVVKLYSGVWFPYLGDILPILLATADCSTMVLRFSRNLQQKAIAMQLQDGMVVAGELEDEVVEFKEHGINFSANVIKGHKTGYFLDHRHNRKRVGELAKGKTMLDVFSYAGGFSVHALAGGATAVTSLDISAQALDMAKQNAALNAHAGEHHLMAIDAFEGLQKLIKAKKSFDIVVIDPPSFAKSAAEVQKARHSYGRLAQLGAKLVAPNGILVLASCSSRVSADDFFDICDAELQNSGRRFKSLAKTYHDIDHPVTFPEGAYLKCGYYQLIG
ncbi:class I SAM-dependent rRNA methyltransferase [Sungkyunkwania multivorans]|uniref:Class I SAM-dependent rRNA methyltransferase n=1 Tax=Sungkyunkwania multivorans TaxID=1173618 RepID=A0ABW3CZ96_9FLAO